MQVPPLWIYERTSASVSDTVSIPYDSEESFQVFDTVSIPYDSEESFQVSDTVSIPHDSEESFQDYIARMDLDRVDYGPEFFKGSWMWKHALQMDFLRSRGLRFLDGFTKLGIQDQTRICVSISRRCGNLRRHAFLADPFHGDRPQRGIFGERIGLESGIELDSIKNCNDG